MKDVSIRELKAHVSELVNHVAEAGVTYTITRRGRAVGALVPAADKAVFEPATGGKTAWDAVEEWQNRIAAGRGNRQSAVADLSAARR